MNPNNPKISVVMSVYNGEKYIKQAVQSVLNQTEPSFELLITDDCSTDNTINILHLFQDKRITIIKNQQQIGLTRNLVNMVSKSRGKYIARLDADDVCKFNRLEIQSKILDNTDTFMVCSYAEKIGQRHGIIKTPTNYEFLKADMLFRNPIVHSSVMFRNNIFNYDVAYLKAQDYELWDRILDSGQMITVVKKTLIEFRYHSNQISNVYNSEQAIFANKVRLRKLKRLGIKLNEKESQVICNFINNRFNEKENKDFIVILDILRNIEQKNDEIKYWDPVKLRNVLSLIYLKLFLVAKKNNIKLMQADKIYIMSRFNKIQLIKTLITNIILGLNL